MKNNGLTTPTPGEFERFMTLLICQSVEKSMEKYFNRIPPDLLTIEDAAKILKVDEETVRRRCRNGDLKGSKVGKFMRIEMSDLREFLKNNRM